MPRQGKMIPLRPVFFTIKIPRNAPVCFGGFLHFDNIIPKVWGLTDR